MSGGIEWRGEEPRPGGTLRGRVVEVTGGLEVRLFWQVSRGGRDQVEVVATADPGAGGEFEFRLPERPWSCDTHFFRLEWGVEAVVKGKPLALRNFVLSPDGRERRLKRIPNPESSARPKWMPGTTGTA